MGDLLGILLFVAFLAISLFGKLAKNQQGEQERGQRMPGHPSWPGPVAPPGLPGYPRPAWPPAPSQPPRPQMAPRPTDDDDDEGVSMEGVGTEGPSAGETVQQELTRFGRETERLARPMRGEYRPQLQQYQSHLQQLQTVLHAAVAPQQPEAAQAGGALDIEQALADRESVARAVVLAEVLGKPKALRGHGR